jgi:uncharacterized damage-inducible protein DinB
MPMNQGLLGEFDHEMVGTRKTLERIPEDKFDWAPHKKSMPLGKLALHLAQLPGWVKETMTLDSLDIGKDAPPPPAKNRAEILALFDKNVGVARGILQSSTDDAQFFKPWSLMNGGTTILTLPKIAVLRGFVFNHTVHHRAQLGVYLRLNDIPVPSIYGPSADENTF